MSHPPQWPRAAQARGIYESFYLRAVDPRAPRAVWIRYTVHKRPGHEPLGSLWFTLFDEGAHAVKHTVGSPNAVDWIEIDGARFGRDGARGRAGEAEWNLRISPRAADLAHLPARWMYRAPLPKTKPESPLPDATFDGRLRFGDRELDVRGWRGMCGHNWGSEHADTWIWLHGVAFEEDETAWVDLTLGRVRIGPVTTPWIANGAVEIGGRRRRIGRLGRPAKVHADARGAELDVPGAERVRATVRSSEDIVVWRYASPLLEERHSAHCSTASLALDVGERRLTTRHACAYELGAAPGAHGDLPLQPYPDGTL